MCEVSICYLFFCLHRLLSLKQLTLNIVSLLRLTFIHMAHLPPAPENTPHGAFTRLLKIMETLRQECPWDKKQTMESLRHLTIEEMYELADAILEQDDQEIRKELGDLLMHMIFYAEIAREENRFDIVEVLNGICDKLIHRHPHIYGQVEVENEQQVKDNWEAIKLKEGNRSVLQGVPNSLPALVKAYRIQDKVKGVGFDWKDSSQVWDKVREELEEFRTEFNPVDGPINVERAEQEYGDLLFSLINYGRHLGLNPENALERTNKKFIKRFQYIEQQADRVGKTLGEMNLEEMDRYWNEAKAEK